MSSIVMKKSSPNSDLPSAVTGKISDVIRLRRREQLRTAGILASATVLFVLLIAILCDWMFVLFEPSQRIALTFTTMIGSALFAGICFARPFWKRFTDQEAARHIDAQFPELEERWSSVMSFSATQADQSRRGSELFIRKVTDEAVQLEHIIEPQRITLWRPGVREWGLLGLVAVLWILVSLFDPAHVAVLVRRLMSPTAAISLTHIQSDTADSLQPRGKTLKLTAKVSGRIYDSAALSIRREDGTEETIPLQLIQGDPPHFSFPLDNLQESFAYRFRSGDGQTPWHRITVTERPLVKAVELRVIPPAYSKLPIIHQQSLPKSLNVLQGSRWILEIQADMPLKSLVLQGENSASAELTSHDSEKFHFETVLLESWSFRPVLESPHGLHNEHPPRCEILVYADQAPSVAIAEPTADVAVRPDDSVTIVFDAKDDLGITAAELVLFEGSSNRELKAIPIPLGEQAGEKTVHAQADLNLNELKLKQGDELSYAIRVYDSKDSSTLQRPLSEQTRLDQGSQPGHDSENVESSLAESSPSSADDNPSASQPISEESQTSKSRPQTSEIQSSENDSKTNDSNALDKSVFNTKPAAAKDLQKTSTDKNTEPSRPQADGGNTWMPESEPKDSPPQQPGGEMAGTPRPDFHMAKHELDTPGQSINSARRRITIDEWAGSYASQVLEKLQLKIDPVLQKLKESLNHAQQTLEPVHQRMIAKEDWKAEDSANIRQADGFLKEADDHIIELTLDTDGTPYAFIGLQLQDIGQLHVQPARNHLSGVALLQKDVSEKDLAASLAHIAQALRMLEDLTRQYEAVKLNQKLDDTLARIKKMHQLFLDGTFALLQSQKPTLNPKNREMMELELSEEFLQQLQELLEKKLEIQAELAKILSEDPRLLQRYMARSRLEATSLRDQLTLLHQRQQDLAKNLNAGLPAEDNKSQKFSLGDRHADQVADAERIVQEVATMMDNYVIWMPLNLETEQEELKEHQSKLVEMAAQASDMLQQSQAGKNPEAIEAAERLHDQLIVFQDTLPDLLNQIDDPGLPTHIANRVQEAERLVTDVSGWVRQEKMLEEGKDHLVAEVIQHRIAVDTAELSRKLMSLEAQCRGISPELRESAEVFLQTMEEDLPPELEVSQISLSENQVRDALQHQLQSVEYFRAAEQQLDDIMEGIIAHLDAQPYNKTPNLPELESLEDLLALLEDEARAAESLGIPLRPSNLLIEKDWFQPGASGSGGGSSGGSGGRRSLQPMAQRNQSREAQKLAEKIRQQSQAALRKMNQGNKGIGAGQVARPQERVWDTLGSALEDHLRQSRGDFPPEQYRSAIEQYFESLAGSSKETNKP